MAARNEQRNGWRDNLAALEHINADVANQVVDRIDRFAGGHGERFGCTNADHKRACQTWSIGNCDCVDFT